MPMPAHAVVALGHGGAAPDRSQGVQRKMSVSLKVAFADEGLLDRTLDEYRAAVERGDITEAEGVEDITALALGMLVIQCLS